MKRQISIITICVIASMFHLRSFGQCTADAGRDTLLCVSFGLDTFNLGGAPTVTGGTAPYAFTWTCNYSILNTLFFTASDFLDDTTSANPQLTSYSADTLAFHLTVTDSLGNSCSDTVVIRFCEYAWTLDWKFVYINQGDTAQITPGVAGSCPPLIFEWLPDYNISDPNIASPLVWPDTTTVYSATVTDAGGCQAAGGTFDVFVIPLGINENRGEAKFEIFPHPLTDRSTISVISNGTKDIKVIFYDIFGREASQLTINKFAEISRADFYAGIYFYRVMENDKITGHGKLLVE